MQMNVPYLSGSLRLCGFDATGIISRCFPATKIIVAFQSQCQRIHSRKSGVLQSRFWSFGAVSMKLLCSANSRKEDRPASCCLQSDYTVFPQLLDLFVRESEPAAIYLRVMLSETRTRRGCDGISAVESQ